MDIFFLKRDHDNSQSIISNSNMIIFYYTKRSLSSPSNTPWVRIFCSFILSYIQSSTQHVHPLILRLFYSLQIPFTRHPRLQSHLTCPSSSPATCSPVSHLLLLSLLVCFQLFSARQSFCHVPCALSAYFGPGFWITAVFCWLHKSAATISNMLSLSP